MGRALQSRQLVLEQQLHTFRPGDLLCHFFFFFNDPAPTEISPLSLPDALPICLRGLRALDPARPRVGAAHLEPLDAGEELRSEEHTSELQSRGLISYAVFC